MDYCTLFPEGWWGHCCEAHDADYAAQTSQLLADTELMLCVTTAGYGWLAPLSAVVGVVMYIGVRTFGRRWYNKAGKQT